GLAAPDQAARTHRRRAPRGRPAPRLLPGQPLLGGGVGRVAGVPQAVLGGAALVAGAVDLRRASLGPARDAQRPRPGRRGRPVQVGGGGRRVGEQGPAVSRGMEAGPDPAMPGRRRRHLQQAGRLQRVFRGLAGPVPSPQGGRSCRVDAGTLCEGVPPMIRVLSLGAGVQSTTVLLMSCKGVLPKLDAAVFADTQWEPQAVYKHLAWLEVEAKGYGIPILRGTRGDLRADALEFRRTGGKASGEEG